MKSLFKLDFSHLRGDLFGGVTAGVVALPLALAFGAQTELGAIAGLYGAIALGVLAAFFGGTPTQVSGPTAPMTVVSAVIVLDAINTTGSIQAALPVILAAFFLGGLLEMLLGVLRIGRYIRYIPHPVVSGFMSGIGVIIIIGQLFPFFGAPAPAGGAWATLAALPGLPALIDWEALGVALTTVLIIYGWPRISKLAPSPLVALVVVSVLVYFFFPQGAVKVINDATEGGMPTGLPPLHLDFFGVLLQPTHWSLIGGYVVTLAALGAIDSLLTSMVADNLTKTRHHSDQELIGQGIGNMAAALIGGLPGAGATMRTVINIQSGGRTRLSGMMAGLFLLAVLLGLGPLVGLVPNALLAGILLTVGIGIIDYRAFAQIRNVPPSDAAVMVVVLLVTVFVGLLQAVAIGMVMASLWFMKNIADITEQNTHRADLKEFAHEIPWADEGDVVKRIGHLVRIKRLNGPLFFGFSSQFAEIARGSTADLALVIIRMGRVPYVDQSGLYAMEEAVRHLQEQGIAVAFSGLTGQPRLMFERNNLVPGLVGKEYCFKTFQDCLAWLLPLMKDEKQLRGLAKRQVEALNTGNFFQTKD